MKLTIGELRVVKAALDCVPSYVMEENHRTMYDAARLSYLFDAEIERNVKLKEEAEKQRKEIRKHKAEEAEKATFKYRKSKLEKTKQAKVKREQEKKTLDFPSLKTKAEKNG